MVIGVRRSSIPRSIQIAPIKYFVAGSTVRSAAALTGVNRHTATLYFDKLRELTAEQMDAAVPKLLAGENKIIESYFGGVRKGKRGRGAPGKVPVFGLLKRLGKIHAVISPNANSAKNFADHTAEDQAGQHCLLR